MELHVGDQGLSTRGAAAAEQTSIALNASVSRTDSPFFATKKASFDHCPALRET